MLAGPDRGHRIRGAGWPGGLGQVIALLAAGGAGPWSAEGGGAGRTRSALDVDELPSRSGPRMSSGLGRSAQSVHKGTSHRQVRCDQADPVIPPDIALRHWDTHTAPPARDWQAGRPGSPTLRLDHPHAGGHVLEGHRPLGHHASHRLSRGSAIGDSKQATPRPGAAHLATGDRHCVNRRPTDSIS